MHALALVAHGLHLSLDNVPHERHRVTLAHELLVGRVLAPLDGRLAQQGRVVAQRDAVLYEAQLVEPLLVGVEGD